jgi:hypothetical protein
MIASGPLPVTPMTGTNGAERWGRGNLFEGILCIFCLSFCFLIFEL